MAGRARRARSPSIRPSLIRRHVRTTYQMPPARSRLVASRTVLRITRRFAGTAAQAHGPRIPVFLRQPLVAYSDQMELLVQPVLPVLRSRWPVVLVAIVLVPVSMARPVRH